jgi:hypothetical protein
VSRSADPTPIACSLGRDDLSERRERWQRLGARAAVEVVPTDRGLRLVFCREPGVEDELRELAALERDCCAFADWSVSTPGGSAVLEVGGSSDEAVAAVQAMFGSLRGRS